MRSLEFTTPEIFTLIESLEALLDKWRPFGTGFTKDIEELMERLEAAYADAVA